MLIEFAAVCPEALTGVHIAPEVQSRTYRGDVTSYMGEDFTSIGTLLNSALVNYANLLELSTD